MSDSSKIIQQIKLKSRTRYESIIKLYWSPHHGTQQPLCNLVNRIPSLLFLLLYHLLEADIHDYWMNISNGRILRYASFQNRFSLEEIDIYTNKSTAFSHIACTFVFIFVPLDLSKPFIWQIEKMKLRELHFTDIAN